MEWKLELMVWMLELGETRSKLHKGIINHQQLPMLLVKLIKCPNTPNFHRI